MRKKVCFTIMPFSDPFNEYWEEIYKPAIVKSGLVPKRADDIYKSGVIVNDIIKEIWKSDVILAELTTKNPNVLYELGIAHALGKPVIMLTQKIEDIPFDLRHLRCIIYDTTSPNWAKALAEEINKALLQTISSPETSLAFEGIVGSPFDVQDTYVIIVCEKGFEKNVIREFIFHKRYLNILLIGPNVFDRELIEKETMGRLREIKKIEDLWGKVLYLKIIDNMLLSSPHDWLVRIYSDLALELLKNGSLPEIGIQEILELLEGDWADVSIRSYFVKEAKENEKILGIFDNLILAHITVWRGRGEDFFDFASYPSMIAHIFKKDKFTSLDVKSIQGAVRNILSSKNIFKVLGR